VRIKFGLKLLTVTEDPQNIEELVACDKFSTRGTILEITVKPV